MCVEQERVGCCVARKRALNRLDKTGDRTNHVHLLWCPGFGVYGIGSEWSASDTSPGSGFGSGYGLWQRAPLSCEIASGLGVELERMDSIAVSIYAKHSISPCTQPICTRCCSTMTSMIQVCRNFQRARACIINTHPDKIVARECAPCSLSGFNGKRFPLQKLSGNEVYCKNASP